MTEQEYNVIDLFSGCGGFSLGVESASHRFNVIAAIDIDEKTIKSYEYNLGLRNNTKCIVQDLTKFPPEDLERDINKNKVDMIIGGPPCPGFSNIGRSKIMGLIRDGTWEHSEERHQFIEDPRNKLFYEYVEYVKYFRPKIFIFENVKGLGSYKHKREGSVFDIITVIKEEFEKLGYLTKEEILNSAEYGVPQFRERYFIVGIDSKITKKYDFSFPKPTHDVRDENLKQTRLDRYFTEGDEGLRNVTAMQALIDLPPFVEFVEEINDQLRPHELSVENAIEKFRQMYADDPYIEEMDDFSEMEIFLETMRHENDILTQGGGDPKLVSCHYPRLINDLGDREIFPLLKTERDEYFKYEDLDEDLQRFNSGGFGDRMRRIPWWKPSWTIIAHLKTDGYMFIHPDRITPQHRSITVREAARLQSFPDSFDFSAGGEIARGHQFQQVGNAVPPLVAKALGEAALKWLNNHQEEVSE